MVNEAAEVQEQRKTLPYPYPFFKIDDEPETPDYFYINDFYARESCAMRAVSLFASPSVASSARSHFSKKAKVGSGAKGTVEGFKG